MSRVIWRGEADKKPSLASLKCNQRSLLPEYACSSMPGLVRSSRVPACRKYSLKCSPQPLSDLRVLSYYVTCLVNPPGHSLPSLSYDQNIASWRWYLLESRIERQPKTLKHTLNTTRLLPNQWQDWDSKQWWARILWDTYAQGRLRASDHSTAC